MIEMNKIEKMLVYAVVGILLFITTGCHKQQQIVLDIPEIVTDSERNREKEKNLNAAEAVASVYNDIYVEAIETNTVGTSEIVQRIIARLGENGYAAVDSANQIDMTKAEQVINFCKMVDAKEDAELTIIVVTATGGFQKFDFQTDNGRVNITRASYEYDREGCLKNIGTVSYPADVWQYTDEGYLLFEGSYFSDERFVLMLSDASEHAALRVLPLNERCRALNQQYILPIGYKQNNLFLCDWSEADFGELNFYDMFDTFYPILFQNAVPYIADENLGVGAIYSVPEEIFEAAIMKCFRIDKSVLQEKTEYISENAAYEYKPRGFYEAEYAEIPQPEVVSYTENKDGTITLTVNAIYANGNTSKAFSHKVTIRLLDEGAFQYVSNQVILPGDEYDMVWHCSRLTAQEWNEIYGEGIRKTLAAPSKPLEVHSGNITTEKESESLSSFLPQSDHSLISEEEKKEMEKMALTAADQVKEVYSDVEIINGESYGSNIKTFTKEQRREVVKLLGQAGFISITEDTNMENYEKIEEFYAAYTEKKNARVTVFHVNIDGLIGAVNFIYQDGELQTYYVGIEWKEGGIPQIKDTLVRDIAEIKLTQKGYFIYSYQETILHADVCQYWRIKPLSEKCRALTQKYIAGLSYVNYNVLVTNWDSSNVERILMPCMFEDIYRIATGENIPTKYDRIPADVYEQIMTTYFPVSAEQLRKSCGYDENSSSYAYEMIFANPSPPFGEVIDYKENADGTITLFVDAVWTDYFSDFAFTNEVVVLPFADGTFRYLSNKIEQKEMELPAVAIQAGR